MPLNRLPKPLLAALLALLVAGVAALAQLTTPAEVVRESAFDMLLARSGAPPKDPDVVVVDIDRPTLERVGGWPWSRDRLAALIEAVALAKPRAIGLDILLVGPDERAPGSLARTLAGTVTDPKARRFAEDLAQMLPDADVTLAAALRLVPVALGLVLDAEAPSGPPPPPVLVRGAPRLADAWATEVAAGSIDTLAAAARGQGILLLPGDADARIRRVPLMVATRGGIRPGLAFEVVRLALGSSSYVVAGDTRDARTGGLRLGLGDDGMLRLRPVPEAWHLARTASAADLLGDAAVRARVAGKLVLIGSSAPELGGLRPSAAGLLIPSVQIQADAAAQILRADAPSRPVRGPWLEYPFLLASLFAVGLAALTMSPLAAAALGATVIAVWLALAGLLASRRGILLDPVLMPVALAANYGIALLISATETRRREGLVRRRFEQHLAPAIVQRIVAEPHLLKLEGEAREITVLFSDIEGFTALTERAGPVELVKLLDRYIDGASRIIVEHGGMVDKVIGDGMHALFNAPLDLADHPRRALDCALALQVFSEALRAEPDARRLGLGRTRIGIETGPVIVGDVGGGKRLNYTAHGNAVNRAARLEAANKELASTICIGPVAAARLPAEMLRPLGSLSLRGVGEAVAVYEPWPETMDAAARDSYRTAFSDLAHAPERARAQFARLLQVFPGDRVLARLAAGARGGAAAAGAKPLPTTPAGD